MLWFKQNELQYHNNDTNWNFGAKTIQLTIVENESTVLMDGSHVASVTMHVN